MKRFQWLALAALIAGVVYELVAAITGRWLTISEMVWSLEAKHPAYAVLLAIGFVVLFVHFFVRKWT